MTIHTKTLSNMYASAPKKIGVYRFFDSKGRLLYVGKAVNIRARLRQHFARTASNDAAKMKLLTEIRRVSWELCATEPEALIREAELIKKIKPRYNVLLRDDKNYAWVAFTKDPFPKVSITHQPQQHGTSAVFPPLAKGRVGVGSIRHSSFVIRHSTFIGPFTDVGSLKRIVRFLRRAFPYCTCRTPHARECLSGTLGRCLGICCLKPKMQDLKYKAEDRRSLLKQYRKNVKAIQDILRGKRQRLLATWKGEMRTASRKERFEEAAALRDRITALQSVFEHAGAIANDTVALADERAGAIRQLKKILGLKQDLRRIEMYDMSNIQGSFAVGSMVVFKDGMPEGDQYRRFRIRTVEGVNDVAMMREVISRRLGHAPMQEQSQNHGTWNMEHGTINAKSILKPKTYNLKTETSPWPLPDILCVDGGIPQMGAVVQALKNLKPESYTLKPFLILGLAKGKDELHIMEQGTGNTEHVASESLDTNVSGYMFHVSRTIPRSRLPRGVRNLLTHLQEESHRFAIGYYRKLHSASVRL